jgi:hypothetical protein
MPLDYLLFLEDNVITQELLNKVFFKTKKKKEQKKKKSFKNDRPSCDFAPQILHSFFVLQVGQ